jgi:hypothetical protein
LEAVVERVRENIQIEFADKEVEQIHAVLPTADGDQTVIAPLPAIRCEESLHLRATVLGRDFTRLALVCGVAIVAHPLLVHADAWKTCRKDTLCAPTHRTLDPVDHDALLPGVSIYHTPRRIPGGDEYSHCIERATGWRKWDGNQHHSVELRNMESEMESWEAPELQMAREILILAKVGHLAVETCA